MGQVGLVEGAALVLASFADALELVAAPQVNELVALEVRGRGVREHRLELVHGRLLRDNSLLREGCTQQDREVRGRESFRYLGLGEGAAGAARAEELGGFEDSLVAGRGFPPPLVVENVHYVSPYAPTAVWSV